MWSHNARSLREWVADVSGVAGDPDSKSVSASAVPHLLADQSGRLVCQSGRVTRQHLALMFSRPRAVTRSRAMMLLMSREDLAIAGVDRVARLRSSPSVL